MLRGLVIEHLIPVNHLIREALDDAATLTPETLVPTLRAHGAAVVITKHEDDLLTRAKVQSQMPSDWDGSDLWARARLAGLELTGFAPLGPVKLADP